MQPDITDPIRVLMITEGTYPFYWGGVSTWCHSLLHDLPEVDYTLISIVSNTHIKPQFELPANVKEFRPVPLWGIREALETRPGVSLADILRRKRRAAENRVADEFIPIFRSFLDGLFADDSAPQRLGQLIHQMYRFFLDHDFDATLRSRAAWECFIQAARDSFPHVAAQHGYPGAGFDLSDITAGMQWLYRWLFPLAQPLPRVDVAHAAMVGLCTLVAVAVKVEYGAAYLLTEHGVYLRECYLAEASSSGSLFPKLLKLRFARRMTDVSYAWADQISPCCDYNQRWELRNGASPDRLQTIYYGVDSAVFTPAGKPVGDPPVVVWVGRINPLKDLDTLLRAAALVHRERPDIQFRLYGSATAEDEPYHRAMLALRAELGLEDAVVFAGYVSNPQAAFNEGDVVVLSSISEAFPFCILEAMLCGKPVVATAVGGVPEEIEGCGITVEPRNPREMAEAVLALMNDPARCAALGRAAREKAVQDFSAQQSARNHYSTYLRLFRHSEAFSSLEAPSAPPKSIGTACELPSADAALDISSHLDPGDGRQLVLTAQRKPRALAVGACVELVAMDTDAILGLADEMAIRVPLPVDALEITAVIESWGITDEVATQRYGTPDVFCLADEVLTQMRLSK